MASMNSRSPIFSCLSGNVRQMFCTVGVSRETEDLFSASSCFALDISKLGGLLGTADKGNTISAPWCKETLGRLSASINYVKNVYSTTSVDTFKKWSPFLTWTAETKVFEDCFRRLQDPDGSGTILSVLRITAILERCLGDVLFTERIPVPFLLKDILGTQKLRQIFGRELMAMLCVVMGPPCSLNLRNVVWHGFMTSEELDPRYAYLLICIVITMGKQLEQSGYGSILRRKLFSLSSWEPSLCHLSESKFDENEFLFLLEHSSLVLPGRLATWRTCIKLCAEASYVPQTLKTTGGIHTNAIFSHLPSETVNQMKRGKMLDAVEPLHRKKFLR